MAAPIGPGPLDGLRVVELAHPHVAFAGKLLADAGADAVVVEPPGGADQRHHGPYADDRPGPERSLAWWADNTSKRSVVADLDRPEGRDDLRGLLAAADVLLEAERPGRLAELGLDVSGTRQLNPRLVHVAITPFGQEDPRSLEPVTDLTILAEAGPVWSCGYDDHTLPPVRGGGEQATRIAAHFAVMSVLTALLHREVSGRGQFVDVSMNAAANVTTEFASYTWLATRQDVQRQTGRHASTRETQPTQVRCADGRWLNTGVPPRTPAEFAALHRWLVDLDLLDDFPLHTLLAEADRYDHMTLAMIEEDPLVGEIFGAGRDAVTLIASRLPAHEAFVGLQDRGLAAGVVYAPDEVLTDPHFVARGWPTEVDEPEAPGGTVTMPGAPIAFTRTPMGPRHRAPHLGEHTAAVLADWTTERGADP